MHICSGFFTQVNKLWPMGLLLQNTAGRTYFISLKQPILYSFFFHNKTGMASVFVK